MMYAGSCDLISSNRSGIDRHLAPHRAVSGRKPQVKYVRMCDQRGEIAAIGEVVQYDLFAVRRRRYTDAPAACR